MLRASTNDDGTSVDLLGIDPGSFASSDRTRRTATSQASSRPSRALTTSRRECDRGARGAAHRVAGRRDPQRDDRRSPGPIGDLVPRLPQRSDDGRRRSRRLEASDLGLASEVWIHDPPPDAVQILRDSGFLIRGSTSASDVFEVTSFLTVRWSYQVFAAFGVLIGVVLVVVQVLVLDARRRSRQASSVIGRRMGLGLGEEATAIFVELIVPFVLGALIGFAAAVAIVHLAIGHLDTLRNLEPPARVVVDLTSIGAAVLVGMVALLALAGIGTIAVARVKPMEAMRSAD